MKIEILFAITKRILIVIQDSKLQIFLVCLSLVLALPAFAQIEEWTYTYNGPANNADEARSVVFGSDGNLYAAGFSFELVGDNDFAILSIDTTGSERWVYTYDGPGHFTDGANALVYGADDNLYAAGWSNGGSADIDITVISVDSAGGERWVYRYNGTANYVDNAFSIAYGLDGNIYAAGFTFTFAAGVTDFIVISLTPSGGLRWIYNYDGGGRPWNGANSIIYGPDNYIYAAGYCGGMGNDIDFAVICIDTAGNEEWIYKYDGPASDDDEAKSIVFGADGNLYAAGYSSGNSTGSDLTIVSLTTSGDENWVYQYNGSGNGEDDAKSLVFGLDNNLYAAGYTQNASMDSDLVVVSVDTGGNEQWIYSYDGPAAYRDEAYSLVFGSDHNIYTAGYSFDSGTREDITVVSLDSTGEELGVYRYNGSRNLQDQAYSIIYGPDNHVYAAGMCFNNNTIVDIFVTCLEPVFSIEEQSSTLNLLPSLTFVSSFFKDKICIRFTEPLDRDLKIVIYNVLGELVYEKDLFSTSSFLELKDNRLGRLPQGVYFLSLSHEHRDYLSEKIIKY